MLRFAVPVSAQPKYSTLIRVARWTACMKKETNWVRLLAYTTGRVNLELLLQNEYLAAENRTLRAHLPDRLQLSDAERARLAEIGKRLGR